MQICIDSLRSGTSVAANGHFIVKSGEPILCAGWAFPDVAGNANVVVGATIDGRPVPVESWRLSRPDVAEHFKRPDVINAGFAVEIRSADLTLDRHQLSMTFASWDGTTRRTDPVAFSVIANPSQGAMPFARILLAASPKSGCTFAGTVLAKYYQVQATGAQFDFLSEHILSDEILGQLAGQSWAIPMHIWPRATNLAKAAKHNISIIVTWRNLADTIVSFEQHLDREWHGFGGPEVYLGRRELWAAQPSERRQEFLIRNLVPWYVGFYRAWRDAKSPLVMAYEQLAVDPTGYFVRIIEHLSGTVDRARLEDAIRLSGDAESKGDYEKIRFNAGVNGRANERMSDRAKRMLEEMIESQYDDVSELLAELPWREGAAASLAANPARWAAAPAPPPMRAPSAMPIEIRLGPTPITI